MDVISSAEFRKRYAKLTEATVVTVNGHVIGSWFPGSVVDAVAYMDRGVPVGDVRGIDGEHTVEFPDIKLAVVGPGRPFNTRPFTPVPKSRR